MKICVYAICKNESKFVRRWMDSMTEADAVIVLDTGSEDDTVEKLRQAGAVVVQQTIAPWRFDAARNQSLALVPDDADICVCTDLDEVFQPGWRAKLEAAWQPGTTQASYRYTWNFNPDGSEGYVFWIEKIHARHGFQWTHPVHEVLTWIDPETPQHKITVEGIQLDHHADDQKSRGQYLELLELSVQESPEDDRNRHYLGREYFFYGQWDHCIAVMQQHLAMPNATWADERCASMRYIAKAYQQKGDLASAERWFWRAIAEAPHVREPYIDFAMLLYHQKAWDGMIYMLNKALSITERPRTYICESNAWGSLPWDLRSLGYYYTGRMQQAFDDIKQAVMLAPQDERLKENMAMIEREMAKSPSADIAHSMK